MRFNSHVERLLVSTVALVNELTPGQDGGRPVGEPAGDELVEAVARAVRTQGYAGRTTAAEARALLAEVRAAREVIEAIAADDLPGAAARVNAMLVRDTGPATARPSTTRAASGCTSTGPTTPSAGVGRPASRPASPWPSAATAGNGWGCARRRPVTGSTSTSRRTRTVASAGPRCQSRVKAAEHRRRRSRGQAIRVGHLRAARADPSLRRGGSAGRRVPATPHTVSG